MIFLLLLNLQLHADEYSNVPQDQAYQVEQEHSQAIQRINDRLDQMQFEQDMANDIKLRMPYPQTEIIQPR